MTVEEVDQVVIGAGFAGLASAKASLQLHPERSLVVLEAAPTVGGVWAAHRLFDGLRTNNMLGTYEYPDFPMDTATFGVKPGEHIPGRVVHKYLNAYAAKFGVADKIRCGWDVVSAEHQEDEGGWRLTVAAAGGTKKILARRLVVATGLTSEPFMPHIEGQETYGNPIFHRMSSEEDEGLLTKAKNFTVFGGTKSAWDAVYAAATKGVQVDWIIRESGHGPTWMAPPYVTPLKKWLEKLVVTRLLTWFSPCIWGDADGFAGVRSLLHGTWMGRAVVNTFWGILGGDVVTLNKFDSHPELAKLKPWSNPMFVASSFSILNYPTDFFELVRAGTVRVHIADLKGLSKGKVHLADGTALPSDALCCVTGWKHVPAFKMLPEGLDARLGVPHPAAGSPLANPARLGRADAEILMRFPRLRNQPVQNAKLKPLLEEGSGLDAAATDVSRGPQDESLTAWALHRLIAPPDAGQVRRHRDVAFAGVMMNFDVPMVSHVQALWIQAYFDDALAPGVVPRRLPEDEADDYDDEDDGAEDAEVEALKYQTVLHSRFGKWRYPAGHGDKFPDFVFDALPYIDWLVGDLGLRVHRKKNLLAEALQPYGPEDYADLFSEWVAKKRV
ncbi:hypothetical protein GGTG_09955 [Gaeumannomyces tritici R3-111a-1]|uniref:FAD/NAD(P)-binding domain-containing protein n=1 Tax=Gaeumannomyces tritici (strain R3-111a-1) TaxID=644352 RepID=J3P8X0_GAET3|nr:hypothetical protein GGTG_09955 [Gaeumannomyces tritici R3-111a-1]EJT73105.1 hypothetical protein GGTG_09955 [Gaeumannomyces tritici R3-111a-1]